MPVPALLGAASDTVYALDGDVVVRLLVAAVLGGMIGLEREASDQSAGLRTHIAVALGAALFGVISTLGFVEFDRARSETVLQADVDAGGIERGGRHRLPRRRRDLPPTQQHQEPHHGGQPVGVSPPSGWPAASATPPPRRWARPSCS